MVKLYELYITTTLSCNRIKDEPHLNIMDRCLLDYIDLVHCVLLDWLQHNPFAHTNTNTQCPSQQEHTDLIEYVRSREIGLQDVGLADVVVCMCGDHIDMESCLCSTLCKHTQTFTLCKSYDTWTYLPGVPNGADGARTTSAPSAFITISCWMELHLQ